MQLEKDLYGYLWENAYENNCNSYLVHGDRTLLIDPGHDRFVESLVNQIEADGISSELDLILATHSHPDHLEGLASFLKTPAKMAMSREEEEYLLKSGKTLFEMMGQPMVQFRVDLHLKEGALWVGEKRFEIYLTPGHSPGSLSVYWPERKVLFTGDVLFLGGIGRTDFLGGNPRWLKKSIERLSGLDIEILLPGHGEVIIGKAAVSENFEYIRQTFYGDL